MKTKTNKNQNNANAIINDANVIINDSFEVKDSELLAQLNSVNIESFINKVTSSKSIWKKEVLSTFKTEKTARKKLRDMQLNLCIKVNKSFVTKIDLEKSINDLYEFSKNNLIDIKNYTQVSIDNKNNKRQLIDANYKLMFAFLKI
jgi:hypothetical protein